MSIYIEDYTEKSFVVLGNTLEHKDNLRSLGGKWNGNLREGKKGWIYPLKDKEKVELYIETGKVTAPITPTYSIESLVKRIEELEERVKVLESQ